MSLVAVTEQGSFMTVGATAVPGTYWKPSDYFGMNAQILTDSGVPSENAWAVGVGMLYKWVSIHSFIQYIHSA